MSDSPLIPHTHRVTILIAAAAMLVGLYALWRGDNNRDREDSTRDRVQQLESANTALRNELNTALESATQARSELQKQWQSLSGVPQQLKDLTAAHEELRARTERPQRAWSRAEALYLIELAQRRLSFDRDTATAIAALESADTRLASLRDPSLMATRERIAKDLQTLRAIPQPDRTGIMARLNAIEIQIDHLPLKGILVGQRTTVATEPVSKSMLGRAWSTVTDSLATMFLVRHLSDDNGSVVSLEEQSLRRQHLSLLAFTARHAILRNDEAAYRTALDEMRGWLAKYFVESPATDAATQELDSLRAIDIAPALPDISAAAQLLMRVTPSTQATPTNRPATQSGR